MDFKLILDIIVVLLLIPTIVFAVMLNNRLSVLRKNRDELARLIAQFNEATVRAESGIPRLRKAAEDAGKGLQDRVERANALRDDLAFLCERADETATALEQTLRAARNEMKAVPGSAINGNGNGNGVAPNALREPGAPAPGPAPAAQAVSSARPQPPRPPQPQAHPQQPAAPQGGLGGGVAPGEGRPRAQVPAPRGKGAGPLAPPASNLGGGTEDLTRALRGLAEAAESSAGDHDDDSALFSPEPERSEAERELLRALRSVR